jgi:hypothetical protein
MSSPHEVARVFSHPDPLPILGCPCPAWPAVESKGFVIFVTLGLACFVFLGLYLGGDIQMKDGVVTGSEMLWWEISLFVYALIAVFSNIIASSKHAFTTNSAKWGWVNILIWPASYYYTWRTFLNTKRSHESVT